LTHLQRADKRDSQTVFWRV